MLRRWGGGPGGWGVWGGSAVEGGEVGGGRRVGALFWRRGVGRGIACPELRALCVGPAEQH